MTDSNTSSCSPIILSHSLSKTGVSPSEVLMYCTYKCIVHVYTLSLRGVSCDREEVRDVRVCRVPW